MTTTEYSLAKFNPSKMMSGHHVIFISGARGSGKSVLIKDLLHHYHKAGFPRCAIFSATESSTGYFESFVPGLFIFSPTKIEDLQAVYEKQKELKMRQEMNSIPKDLDLRLVIVLDDLGFNKKLMNSSLLREITMNSRHYHVTLILTVQYVMSLDVAMRSNADFAFIFNDTGKKSRERIFEQFCGFLDSYLQFNALFTSCTTGYECMVINCRNRSGRVEDSIYFYCADAKGAYQFGSPTLWNYHSRHYLSPGEKFLKEQRQKRQREISNKGHGFVIVKK